MSYRNLKNSYFTTFYLRPPRSFSKHHSYSLETNYLPAQVVLGLLRPGRQFSCPRRSVSLKLVVPQVEVKWANFRVSFFVLAKSPQGPTRSTEGPTRSPLSDDQKQVPTSNRRPIFSALLVKLMLTL